MTVPQIIAHFFQEGRLYGAGGEYERTGGLSQHSLQHETRGGLQQGSAQVSQTSKTVRTWISLVLRKKSQTTSSLNIVSACSVWIRIHWIIKIQKSKMAPPIRKKISFFEELDVLFEGLFFWSLKSFLEA
jgi:hypothetical protein